MDHHLLYMPKILKNIKYYRDVQKIGRYENKKRIHSSEK